jgi:hypothetical protein
MTRPREHLLDQHPKGAALAEISLPKLTASHAKLDPDLAIPRLVSKWRLGVPQTWIGGRTGLTAAILFLDAAARVNLNSAVVEKDYVFGLTS